MVGMRIFSCSGSLAWMSHAKSCALFEVYGERDMQPLAHFATYVPHQVHCAVMMSGFARCKMLASSTKWLTHSVAEFCNLLRVQAGYPSSMIDVALARWCKQVFGYRSAKVLHAIKHIGHISLVDDAYTSSFTESGMMFCIGRLDFKTL
ncbi:unnamed protein product [Polarella glacialis]|nr:unnamed protein product [Polarella glacialis]